MIGLKLKGGVSVGRSFAQRMEARRAPSSSSSLRRPSPGSTAFLPAKIYYHSSSSSMTMPSLQSLELLRIFNENVSSSRRLATASTSSAEEDQPPPSSSAPTTRPPSPPKQAVTSDEKINLALTTPIGSLEPKQKEFIRKSIQSLCQIRRDGHTSLQSVSTAEKLFRRLLQEAEAAEDAAAARVPAKVWSTMMYGFAHLDGASRLENGTAPFLKAQELLYEMLALHKKNPTLHPEPTDYHCSVVLFACAKCSIVTEDGNDLDRSNHAVRTAEALIKSLEAPESRVPPTLGMYNNVILAHANRAPCVYGAATAAENWLLHLSKRASEESTTCSNTNNNVQLDTQSFNRVLKAWSDTPEEQGAARANEILQLMLDLSRSEEGSRVHPDPVSFGTVISAFGKRGDALKSQAILQQAVEYFNKAEDLTPIRNAAGGKKQKLVDLTQCWTAACFAWSHSGTHTAPERIQDLIQETFTSIGRNFIVRANRAMYAACIHAYLQSNRPDNVAEADKYLRTMVEDYIRKPQERQDAQPTTNEFHSVQSAWFRYQEEGKGRFQGMYAAENATALLLLMIELSERRGMLCAPTTDTIERCILLWTNTCRSLLQAVAALETKRRGTNAKGDENEDDSTRQQQIRDNAMTAALKAVELLDLAEARKLARHQTYKYVIYRLCDIGHPDCTREAVNILQRLERETDQRDLDWPSGDAAGLYVTVIAALGKIGTFESAELALEILRGMPKSGKRAVHATTKAYTSVVMAFSKLHSKRSSRVVFEIFEEVKELDSDPKNKVKLDPVFVEQVLRTLSNVGDKVSAGRSCEVLNFLLKLHFGGRNGVEPTSSCFNACIAALIRCHDRTHLLYAAELLKSIILQHDQKSLSNLPSYEAFVNTVRACREEGSPEMVQRANEIAKQAERLGIERSSQQRHQKATS